MTPKEKAEELVDRCYQLFPLEQNVITTHWHLTEEYSGWNNAKKCALIAVDEILNELDHSPLYADDYAEGKMKYWQEVKQEIEKL